jgi:hypothetical protein
VQRATAGLADIVTDELVALAEKLTRLVSPLTAAFGLVKELSAEGAPTLEAAPDLTGLGDMLAAIGRELGRVQTALAGIVTEDMTTLAGRLNALVEPFRAVLGFWGDLSEFVAAGQYRVTRGRIGDFLATLASQLGLMATELQRVAAWPQFAQLDDALTEFATRLQTIVGPFREVLGFWDDLSEFVAAGQYRVTKGRIGDFLATLASQLGLMATELQRVAI